MEQVQQQMHFVIRVTVLTLIAIALLAFSCAKASAATLDSEFQNDDGDTICVYEAHFHKYYVNVGFTGICHLSVDDASIGAN